MIEILKQKLALTLSHTVRTLGPTPNEMGTPLKTILDGTDDVALIALGCYLEDCVKKDSYSPLVKGLSDIRNGQSKVKGPLMDQEKPFAERLKDVGADVTQLSTEDLQSLVADAEEAFAQLPDNITELEEKMVKGFKNFTQVFKDELQRRKSV